MQHADIGEANTSAQLLLLITSTLCFAIVLFASIIDSSL
jgi:hypothetical protein